MPAPPSAPPRPAQRPAPRATRARPPFLVAAVLALQAGALAYLGYSVAHLERALDRPASPVAEAPRPSAPLAAPQAPAAVSMPAIASLGDGRLIYASPDGKLVVLGRDHVSGELVIEKVYSLEKDDLRNLGDDARRAYSGFYLVDVERVRRENVSVLDGLFSDAASKAAERADGLDRCIEAARALADTGGVDRLRKRLDDRNNFARHAAALALGERGYLAAIPGLIQIVEGTGDTELARRVTLLLRDLTGLPLEANDGRATVAQKVDEWWRQHAPEDPYARRVPSPR